MIASATAMDAFVSDMAASALSFRQSTGGDPTSEMTWSFGEGDRGSKSSEFCSSKVNLLYGS